MNTPNADRLRHVLVSHAQVLGGATAQNLGQATEPLRILYRTTGIADNTGPWTVLDDSGDLSAVSPGTVIQFALEFRTIGLTCIPARVYHVSYLDDAGYRSLGDAELNRCQVQVGWLRDYDRLPVKRRYTFAPHVHPKSDHTPVELIGPVDAPGGSGPTNGMCALLDAANCRAMFCHTEWYRDLIAQHRGPANQSPLIMWPYPIDPWPGGPLPDEYDLLIYAKNGHRPMLLEHLAELFPRHIQIHYGQYQREQLFEAARRSRACAYLADDDHGPLALQEILLAGCPTVGVRTGASFVKSGETGVLADRLPPGRQCVETDEDERALAAYLEAAEQTLAMDRESVRQLSAEQFDTERIIDIVLVVLVTVRESTLSDRSMEIDTICKTL